MNCPRCQLINPDTAQRCDCGYDFETKTIKESYLLEKRKQLKEATKVKRISAIALGALLLLMELGRLFSDQGLVAPSSPEGLGWDIASVILVGLSIWLVWYGLRRRVSVRSNEVQNTDAVRSAEPAQFVARSSTRKDSAGSAPGKEMLGNRGLGDASVTNYSQNVERRIFCNYCGVPNPEDAKFCSSCGHVIVRLTPVENI